MTDDEEPRHRAERHREHGQQGPAGGPYDYEGPSQRGQPRQGHQPPSGGYPGEQPGYGQPQQGRPQQQQGQYGPSGQQGGPAQQGGTGGQRGYGQSAPPQGGPQSQQGGHQRGAPGQSLPPRGQPPSQPGSQGGQPGGQRGQPTGSRGGQVGGSQGRQGEPQQGQAPTLRDQPQGQSQRMPQEPSRGTGTAPRTGDQPRTQHQSAPGQASAPGRQTPAPAPRMSTQPRGEEVASPMIHTVMTDDVVTVTGDATVQEAVARMASEEVGAVVVVDEDGRPDGIITDRTIALSLDDSMDLTNKQVSDLMAGDLTTVRTGTSVYELTETMAREGVRRIPVVDGNDELEGIVSVDDVVVMLASELDNVSQIVRQQSGRT